LQNFQTNPNQDRWKVNVQVQDADGDNDLSQLKLEVTDSNGIVRGSETRSISGQQYNPGNVRINANSGYSVQKSETYSLTATVCDSDGNSRTQTP
jgi:hypothetical protein